MKSTIISIVIVIIGTFVAFSMTSSNTKSGQNFKGYKNVAPWTVVSYVPGTVRQGGSGYYGGGGSSSRSYSGGGSSYGK